MCIVVGVNGRKIVRVRLPEKREETNMLEWAVEVGETLGEPFCLNKEDLIEYVEILEFKELAEWLKNEGNWEKYVSELKKRQTR